MADLKKVPGPTRTPKAASRVNVAKAGHRAPPPVKGPHNTTALFRKEGRYCAKYGLSTEHLKKGGVGPIVFREVRYSND